MSFVLKLPSQLKKGAAEQEHAVKKEQGLVFDVVDPNAHLAWNRNKGGPVWGVKNAPQGGDGGAPEAGKAGAARAKGWNVQAPTGAAFSIAEGLAKLEVAHPHNPQGPPKVPLAGRFGGGGAPQPVVEVVEHPVTAETYKDPVFEGAAWADEVEEDGDDLPVLDIPIPPGPAALTTAAVPKAKEPELRPRPDAWGRRAEGDEDRRGGQQLPQGGSLGMEPRRMSHDLADRRGNDRALDRAGLGDRRAFGPGAGYEGGGRLGSDPHRAHQGMDPHAHAVVGYGRPGERGFAERGVGGYDRAYDGPAGARGVVSRGAYDRGVTLLARPAHANPSDHVALDGPQRFRSTSLPEAPKDAPRVERPEREMRTEDRNPAHPDVANPPISPAMQPSPHKGRAEPAEDMGGWAALGKERTRAALEPAKPVIIMKRPDAPASHSVEDRRRGAAEALAKVKAHVADQPPPPMHHEPRARAEEPHAHAHHAHAHYHPAQSSYAPQQLDAQRAEEKRRFKEEAIARLKAQAEAAQKPPPAVHAAPMPKPEAPAKAVVHPVQPQPQLHVTPQIMRRAPQPEPAPVVVEDVAASGKGKNRRSTQGEGAPEEVAKNNGNTAKVEDDAAAGSAAQGKGKKGKQSKESKEAAAKQQLQQQQQNTKTPREGKAPKAAKQQGQAKPADAAQSAPGKNQQEPKQGQEETPRAPKAQKGPKLSKENSDLLFSGEDKAPKPREDKEAKVFKGNNAPRGNKKNDGGEGVSKAPKARNDAGEAPVQPQEDSNNAARPEECSQAQKIDKSARAPVQIYRPPVRNSKPEGEGGKKGQAEGSSKESSKAQDSPKAEGEGRGGKSGGRGRWRGRGGGGKAGEVSGAPKAEVPATQ